MRVLLVEDDHVMGSAIHNHISDLGHGVDWVTLLDDATVSIGIVNYDVVLLDLSLPDGNGVDFLKNCRLEKIKTPILITTAHDQVHLRIEALKAGADDYLTKPFDIDELTARVEAIVRRSGWNHEAIVKKNIVGNVSIDLARRVIYRDGKNVPLTSREWVVLDCLLRNAGTIVSKVAIEDSIYSFGCEIESNAVEVFVSRIRKKLGSTSIMTARGLGYVMYEL